MTITVLAIDDQRTVRSLVKKVMQDAGFTCFCADDGVQGVGMFAAVQPDVVITDTNMPNLDGYGVISQIRGGAVNRSVPILMMTPDSAQHPKVRAREAGATGWIVKPFDDAPIISVVRRVTGARA